MENINLEQMKVYAAPFGGPIAITKDLKQVKKGAAVQKPVIYIYTSSGRLISTINVSLPLIEVNYVNFQIVTVEFRSTSYNGLE